MPRFQLRNVYTGNPNVTGGYDTTPQLFEAAIDAASLLVGRTSTKAEGRVTTT